MENGIKSLTLLLILINEAREDARIEGLTLAGLLMFGKTESITDVYGCPHYFPDYREYFSSNPDDRWTDRIYEDGTWEANLFQFYHKVYPKLSAVLPKPFLLKGGIREEDTPTHVALREAFIDCLIHCDYSINSTITIELHKDARYLNNRFIPSMVDEGLLERKYPNEPKHPDQQYRRKP